MALNNIRVMYLIATQMTSLPCVIIQYNDVNKHNI